MIASDIGRPVTVIRRGQPGEVVRMRDGCDSICSVGPSVVAWLCDAHDDGFPCFIADYCLIPNRPQEEPAAIVVIAGRPQEKEQA